MTQVHFFKWPLIIFLTGLGIRIIGALVKLRHWPGADELLVIGTAISIAGIIFAIIKLLLLKKSS